MVVIFVDHYTVLGLPTGEEGLKLSSQDIKKRYRLKALELHPDKKPNDPNAVSDFQKLQASFDVLKDESARKVFNDELMVRLGERGEQFVDKDSYEFDDVENFIRKMRAEMRKRERADEFEEMQRMRAVEREPDRMSPEYEKSYREGAPNYARRQWEKKIRREANVNRDMQSIREIYAKRSVDTLFYDINRLNKGEIYV